MVNLEIEFKCPINKEEYERLISKFGLADNVYLLTNYYFDTPDKQLHRARTVLRIRHKHSNNMYKITLKQDTPQGALESHVLLKEDKALELIETGFNLTHYFDKDLDVVLHGKLDNYRVSTPYREGELFLDRIEYFDNIEYEIEYEVDNFEHGKRDFEKFLIENDITQTPFKRKSQRILG